MGFMIYWNQKSKKYTVELHSNKIVYAVTIRMESYPVFVFAVALIILSRVMDKSTFIQYK